MFAAWDANGNGGLSLAEIDKGVVEEYPEYNHKPSLIRAYRAADKDGNGFITRGGSSSGCCTSSRISTGCGCSSSRSTRRGTGG